MFSPQSQIKKLYSKTNCWIDTKKSTLQVRQIVRLGVKCNPVLLSTAIFSNVELYSCRRCFVSQKWKLGVTDLISHTDRTSAATAIETRLAMAACTLCDTDTPPPFTPLCKIDVIRLERAPTLLVLFSLRGATRIKRKRHWQTMTMMMGNVTGASNLAAVCPSKDCTF